MGQQRPWAEVPGFGRQVACALVLSGVMLHLSHTLAWPTVLPHLKSNGTHQQLNLTTTDVTWLASLPSLSCLLTPTLTSVMMELLGPRRVLFIFLLPTTLLWFFTAFAYTKEVLYVARIGIGLSNGLVYTALVPLSIELMSPEVRGMLTTISQIMASAGLLEFYVMAKYLPWRVSTGVCSVPLIFIIIALYFVPESPYWLAKKGKDAAAREALAKIRGPRGNVEEELGMIRRGLAAQPSTTVKDQFRQLRVSSNYKPILLVIAISLFPVFGGRFSIFQYAVFIFQDTGVVGLDPFTCTVLLGAVRLLFTILSSLVIDQVGRRTLLISCSVISGSSLITTGLSLGISSAPKWLPVLSILVFTAFFSLGVPPVCSLVAVELMPTAVRAVANSIMVNILTIGFFLSSVTFPEMNVRLGVANTFYILASFYFLTSLVVWKWVPESRGRTLVELQEAFATDKSREIYRKIVLKKNRDRDKEATVEMLQS